MKKMLRAMYNSKPVALARVLANNGITYIEPLRRFHHKKNLREQHLQRQLPLDIGIQFTGRCNQRCLMCGWHNGEGEWAKRNRDMNLTLFKKIVATLPDSPSCKLNISVGGEALLHKDCLAALSYVKETKPNIQLYQNTNGTLLSREVVDHFLSLPLTALTVSVNTHTAESHRWFTNSTGWDRLMDNMDYLLAERRRRGLKQPHISVQIVGIKELRREILPFLYHWAGKADSIHVLRVHACEKRKAEKKTFSTLSPPPQKRYPCLQPWNQFIIDVDGMIYPCGRYCRFGRSFGQLPQDSFEVWKGKEWQALRNLHQHGQWDRSDLCRDCDIWKDYPNIWNTAFTPDRIHYS